MPKLDLTRAARIKGIGGEIQRLKGAGFVWAKPAGPSFETLAVNGNPFPVTLCRDATRYFVQETGATFLAPYTGITWHVSPTGSDTTGTGTQGNPFRTIQQAVIAAQPLERIQLAPGIYPSPGTISKRVAILGPETGMAYIGSFNNLSAATITATTDGWTINMGTGLPPVGLIRRDGVRYNGFLSGAHCNNAERLTYHAQGYPAFHSGTGSATNYSFGTTVDLPSLVAADQILSWRPDSSTGVLIGGTAEVYFGRNIVIANFATNALDCGLTGSAILDGVDVYGGAESTISCDGSGRLIMFGVTAGGASALTSSLGDTVDYRATATGVEINCNLGLPSASGSDNASTGHDSARILRVGGTYSGGARSIHDINNSRAYTLSCTVRDALFLDRTLMQIGLPTGTTDTSRLVHGNVTYAGVRTNDLRVTGGATAIRSNIGEAWPG